MAAAYLFGYPVTGASEPFQLAISLAAVFYAVIGLVYLKKLFRLNNISDKITALVLLLIFFGTNLMHYTVVESAMSHVYSFCFISAFLYYSNRFVLNNNNSDLIYAAIIYGVILLIRANNGLVLFSVFLWFKDKAQCTVFFKSLVKNRAFYYALIIPVLFMALQLLTWHVKEDNLYTNRYAPYGFSWLHPHFMAMLFGFDGGFFIYTPLCFLCLFGLIFVYKENRFLFYAASLFILGLFYFFSAYSAYTYFDGLGIRVLVDYYAVFALLFAKLFTHLAAAKTVYNLVLVSALFFVLLNLVYSYQSSRNILLRAGMTFNQWKYIFFKTGDQYKDCLGGAHDLTPFAKQQPEAGWFGNAGLQAPFDFSQKDFGVAVACDSLAFNSNRVQLEINCNRKEAAANSSSEALICVSLEDKHTHQNKSYYQFRLNETPSKTCCEEAHYSYTSTMAANFKAGDKLAVYIWNKDKQPFLINNFTVKIYNYNYQIN